jgi:hypothetical protein
VTEPLTDQQIAATQARHEAASDVEWSAMRGGGYPFLITQGTPVADAEDEDKWEGVGLISASMALNPAEDMAFIIAARTDVPALLAEVARLRAADAAVLTVMEHYRDTPGPHSHWTMLSDLAIARDGHIPEALAACSCAAEPVHQAGCDAP